MQLLAFGELLCGERLACLLVLRLSDVAGRVRACRCDVRCGTRSRGMACRCLIRAARFLVRRGRGCARLRGGLGLLPKRAKPRTKYHRSQDCGIPAHPAYPLQFRTCHVDLTPIFTVCRKRSLRATEMMKKYGVFPHWILLQSKR